MARTKAQPRPAKQPTKQRRKATATERQAGESPALCPGNIGRTFSEVQLASLAKAGASSEVDRRLLVPFQSDASRGWEKLVAATAAALAKVPRYEFGAIWAGELPTELAAEAPAPLFPHAPSALVVAGTPIFVSFFVGQFAATIGAAQTIKQLAHVPGLGLLAAVSPTHAVLCEEADLAQFAEPVAASGLNVTLCDSVAFDCGVAPLVDRWVDAVAALPSTKATERHAKVYRAFLKLGKNAAHS